MNSILLTAMWIYDSHLTPPLYSGRAINCLSEVTETLFVWKEVEIDISIFIVLENEKRKSNDKCMPCYSWVYTQAI